MARHFMAVCVVCLLCADHVHCKQHFADDGSKSRDTAGRSDTTIRDVRSLIDLRYEPVANTVTGFQATNDHDWKSNDGSHRIMKRHAHHHHHHDDVEEKETVGETQTEFDRLMKDKMDQAMRKIFTEYGNPALMTMDVQGFERMARQLGMFRLIPGVVTGDVGHTLQDITTSESPLQQEDPLKCISSNEFLRRITPPMIRSQEWEDAAKGDKSSYEFGKEGSNSTSSGVSNSADGRNVKDDTTAKFILSNDNIQNISISNSSTNSNSSGSSTNSSSIEDQPLDQIVSAEERINGSSHNESASSERPTRVESTVMLRDRDLYNVCPMLLGHLLSKVPQERSGCFGEESVPPLQVSSLQEQNDPHQHHHHHHHHREGGSSEAAVWIYSSIAILGVSLCGLLGVAVIPCMEKHFYHHVIQFLVALAIGTLCGDALLHLLPHAMLSSLDNARAAHDSMMYKGLAAVLGIVFFYFMERFLTVIAEWCKTRQKKDKPPSRVRVMRDPESTSLHASSAGEKQCKHKYSSYPYCYDEIAMDTKDDHHEHNTNGTNENHNSALAKCANHHHNGELTADHGAEYTGLNNHHAHNTQSNHQSLREDANDNNTVSTNLDEGSIESEQGNNHHHTGRQGSKCSEQTSGKLRPENYTIILREHETKHHGHSHTHGHVHSPPGSLSAVAWMVVMGDGLHNFTDGMTIGAAFANNIAGGFSTAIAVFCHELPHELGDFAVLLKAGMSAKEAVYYNLLSSLLSLLGMVVGIIVGHQPEASAWVFAVAAGMFLYIAMVDMIPELTSSHGAEERCKTSEFLLQFLGLTLGFSIMMIIAMYEHDLMLLFVD
ncbi:zinc transporter foi [Anopheles moucheti]|uniref:zinc transporter foi n=1 Tax=Anopheles moucheti TaxID=186751 RepID=UPI0022F12102|nr:zinc transporter foi [Anopheles moucheti]XP_052896969.1 zinc transporter foi [Anopheles moucheti]XP_052896970.1 zinc transporter foi [Anopheles moucheti]